MNAIQKNEKIIGFLFLLVFIIGVTVYQFLRGPILFGKDYITNTSMHSKQILFSILLAMVGSIISLIVAVLFLPVFNKFSTRLGYLYVSFSIVYFIAMIVENYAALSLLEVSNEYVKNKPNTNSFLQNLGNIAYNRHELVHYISLLISCLPVFVLYYIFYQTKLIPRFIAVFGMGAVILMSVNMVFLIIMGTSISSNLLIPIALIQLFLPFWIFIKGFKIKIIG